MSKTIVTELTDLYKEIGGATPIPTGATAADILTLIKKKMGIVDTEIEELVKADIYGLANTDLQENLAIGIDEITGSLKYVDGTNADWAAAWGDLAEGHFFAVDFAELPAGVTSIKMGLFPTYKDGQFIFDDSGLVDVTSDPDKGGAFRVTNKDIQSFKVITTDGDRTHEQVYDLSKLIILPAEDAE